MKFFVDTFFTLICSLKHSLPNNWKFLGNFMESSYLLRQKFLGKTHDFLTSEWKFLGKLHDFLPKPTKVPGKNSEKYLGNPWGGSTLQPFLMVPDGFLMVLDGMRALPPQGFPRYFSLYLPGSFIWLGRKSCWYPRKSWWLIRNFLYGRQEVM